jgi:propanol-preferring alcohol dehydrogenase
LTGGYGAHGVICLSGTQGGYEQALSVLRNLGTLICIGLATEDLPISPFKMIVHGLRVLGSSVGTKQELDELMGMAVRGEVIPITSVHKFEELDELLQKLKQNQVTGRVVVMIPE